MPLSLLQPPSSCYCRRAPYQWPATTYCHRCAYPATPTTTNGLAVSISFGFSHNLKVHSLDCLPVSIIVFQRSMASSLTPVQTSHHQTSMLNDFLGATPSQPAVADNNGADGLARTRPAAMASSANTLTAPQSPSDGTTDHWIPLTIPVPAPTTNPADIPLPTVPSAQRQDLQTHHLIRTQPWT